MALIKCSECGREISDKANACPLCGNPIRPNSVSAGRPVEIELTNKKWKKHGVGGVILMLVAFLIMFRSIGLGFFLLFIALCWAMYVSIGRWWTNG